MEDGQIAEERSMSSLMHVRRAVVVGRGPSHWQLDSQRFLCLVGARLVECRQQEAMRRRSKRRAR